MNENATDPEHCSPSKLNIKSTEWSFEHSSSSFERSEATKKSISSIFYETYMTSISPSCYRWPKTDTKALRLRFYTIWKVEIGRRRLRKRWRHNGTTILMISHDFPIRVPMNNNNYYHEHCLNYIPEKVCLLKPHSQKGWGDVNIRMFWHSFNILLFVVALYSAFGWQYVCYTFRSKYVPLFFKNDFRISSKDHK